MNLRKYNLIKLLLPALVAVSMFTACDKTDPVVVGDNLDVTISKNTDLSLFAAALKKSRINTFTQGGGPFTIFAPTNAAFNAVGINTEADINALDSNYLVQVLTYHLQAVSRTYLEIPLGPNATMSTQGGFTQYASRYIGGSAYVNGGKLLTTDIKASNGIIHTINRVLIPPYYNAMTNLGLISDYSLMVAAINKAALTATFNSATATVFAIPNSVMTAAGYDAATIAGLSGAALTTLTNILKHHVVLQRIFIPDFKAGNLKTSQGTNLTVTLGTGVSLRGVNNTSDVKITAGNLLCSNGVLHVVDGLLKP